MHPNTALLAIFATSFFNLVAAEGQSASTGGTVVPLTRKAVTAPAKKTTGTTSVGVTNEIWAYYAPLTIGSQTFQLRMDTGSSNTWVGAITPFKPSPNAVNTGGTITIEYAGGEMTGEEWLDTVELAGLTITNQSFGVTTPASASGITGPGEDGFLGIGPIALTADTVSNAKEVPTVIDNLFAQGTISQEIFGLYFAPYQGSTNSTDGELTIGGFDSSRFTGELTYIPVLNSSSTDVAKYYWGINVNSITVGSKAVATGLGAIVDTGTGPTYIVDSAYNAFLSATHATTDANSGYPTWSKRPTTDVTVSFEIAGVNFALTQDDYLIPEAQYELEGLQTGAYYAWFVNAGAQSPDSLDLILGQKFLEHYYSVYDTPNSRVGLATAVHGA